MSMRWVLYVLAVAAVLVVIVSLALDTDVLSRGCRVGFFLDCVEVEIDPCGQSARAPGDFVDRTNTVSMGPSIKTEHWEARITPDPIPEDFAQFKVTFFTVQPAVNCAGFVPSLLAIPPQVFHRENELDGVGISTNCRIAFIVSGVKGVPQRHDVWFIDPNRPFVKPGTMIADNQFGGSTQCNKIPNVARGVFFGPDMSVSAVVSGVFGGGSGMSRQLFDIDACPDGMTTNGKLCLGTCFIPEQGSVVTIEMADPVGVPADKNIALISISGHADLRFDTGSP